MAPANDRDDTSSFRRGVIVLILLGTALRLTLGALLGLGVDESYAVVVARPVAWSYFDHPPLMFWIAGAISSFGTWSPLAFRLPFIAIFALTTWLTYELGRSLFSPAAGFWTAAALTVSPVLSVASGGWVLPD